ncbi:MFS transporter [Paucibacter sp. DJ2R-2]|uniref:MFS transporter n=1 Tax=Paucibacter sp. DJ2R-2 TaxID=2893558 RepID=UPI0021E45486|nr:MFS transporter [Paucibacter sp. DJ2R-2]MCV2438641.1 MFS transporter [Paucibacter sp. DJ2R-2]
MFDRKRAVLYALPIFFLAIMVGPAGSIIQGIYTREFGVSLSAIATAITLCKILDALTDPVVGMLSDRTRHWPGGRKFWVVLGSVILLIGAYFLFNPTQERLFDGYFFVAYFVTLLGWTVVEVSHLSWGAELSRDYDDRSRIFSYRTGFLFAGTLLFLVLPLIIELHKTGNVHSLLLAEYNGETLRIAFMLIAFVFPLTIFLATRFCPQGEVAEQAAKRVSPRELMRTLRANRPLRIFSAMVVLFFIGNGMQVALAYLHLASYLQLGKQAPFIYAVCLPLNLIMIPVWLKWMGRFEKSHMLLLGIALSGFFFILLGFIRPGPNAFIQYLLVFAALQLVQPAWQILPPSILGDVSDYATLKTSVDQTATFYAIYAFLYKAISGLGAAFGFALASAFGFDPANNTHSASAAFGICMAMAFVPACLAFGAAWCASRLPLSRARHGVIRKRLERRAQRRAAALGVG